MVPTTRLLTYRAPDSLPFVFIIGKGRRIRHDTRETTIMVGWTRSCWIMALSSSGWKRFATMGWGDMSKWILRQYWPSILHIPYQQFLPSIRPLRRTMSSDCTPLCRAFPRAVFNCLSTMAVCPTILPLSVTPTRPTRYVLSCSMPRNIAVRIPSGMILRIITHSMTCPVVCGISPLPTVADTAFPKYNKPWRWCRFRCWIPSACSPLLAIRLTVMLLKSTL